MKYINSLFVFTKNQRIGIFILFALIFLIQIIYLFWSSKVETNFLANNNKEWLLKQEIVDSLKAEANVSKIKIYPFNPNFISDYKGQKLGMSVQEIDRLFKFREQNKYVNSTREFQEITKISDSLLNEISPYFKFPNWVTNKKRSYIPFEKKTEKIIVKDINQATQEDLIKVYGIGPAISERILKFKNALGGFVSIEQINHVWGLSPEVIENVNKYFNVQINPSINKIDINNLTTKELAKFPYFNYSIAKEIVIYRSMNGEIKNINDLSNIKGMPIDKIKIIALYLDF